ncbi:MAG TPA: flagellar biosynthetic protein FliR [Ramlibacter sp.]|nr:flagellar biosynthetic protein FliR [Ramlibacter sp.]
MVSIISALGAPWVATVLLLSARLAALLLMTPFLHAMPVPGVVKALLVLGLSSVLALPFLAAAPPPPAGLGPLLQAFLGELAIGATLGLGILMAFSGFALAGRVLDVQVGFGIAQVLDPTTRTLAPILTSVFSLVGALLFFLVNGHHALLRGVAWSIEKFPIGQPWSVQGAVEPVVRQAAGLFTLGFALAAPVVVCVFLVEFALGVVARNLPQINMLVLGIPVKIVVGLLALSVWAGAMGGPMLRIYGEIYAAWTAWFDSASAAPSQGRR